MENVKVKGILRSVANAVKTNVNGTQYRPCTVEMPDGNTYFAKLWEKSFPNAKVGETYTVEMQEDGEDIWLTVLTGTTAKIAKKADFANLFAAL